MTLGVGLGATWTITTLNREHVSSSKRGCLIAYSCRSPDRLLTSHLGRKTTKDCHRFRMAFVCWESGVVGIMKKWILVSLATVVLIVGVGAGSVLWRYFNLKTKAANYARINIARSFHISPSRVHIDRVGTGEGVLDTIRHHSYWIVIYSLVPAIPGSIGNICEFSENASGKFYGFGFPTA